ncbi:PHLP3-like protein [Mya arenaria]|uniref:PHLP3-like protein n=1 Tax=Mya arenaria TaxID=6604 RepID=A0ABY7E2Y8_MYAAR|nr:PHLP3-like protein [Mya arenaria]
MAANATTGQARQIIDDESLAEETLTEKYFETRFAKINVDKAKFLVEKLKIRVLPALLCFKKRIVVDRVVGVIEMAEEEAEKKTIFGYSDNRRDDADSSDDDY